jgi:uncharacterized membrane protein YbhN (UPF0104 family)/tRNA A-37 threonylcarbamoyl transferase component Bud32
VLPGAEVRDAPAHDDGLLTSLAPRRWAPVLFGVVSQAQVRRRPSDILRLGLALVVVALTSVAARNLTTEELRAYALLHDLPSWARSVFDWCYVASVVVAVVVVIAFVVTQRWRVVARVLLAGAIAAGLAYVVHEWADVAAARNAAFDHHDVPQYPIVLLATVTAALLVAAPFLLRPAHRVVAIAVGFGAVGATVSVVGLPADVIGSLAIGWGAAAAVHLAFGTPAATPTVAQVVAALHELGVTVGDIRLSDHQVWGEARFVGTAPAGETVSIEVLGRDAADARLMAKISRGLLYRDSGPTLSLRRSQQLEHRAYLLLLAARAGVPVSDVVIASVAGAHDDALLVLRDPTGTPFADADAALLTNELLDDVWANVGRLHAARVTHGQLTGRNVLARADGTTALVDFALGSSAALPERAARDCVELLVTTAQRVGVDRALAAALRAVGHDGFAELLPLLEPAALSTAGRHELDDGKTLCNGLRTRGAALVGEEPPKLAELHRVSIGQIVMAAATFLGFYLIVNQFADVDLWGTLQTARVQWIAAVGVLSLLPQVTAAIALTGAVSAPMPFGAVVAEQFANNFTGLIGGTVATTALVIRFFQKQGMSVAVAASSGVLTSFANAVLQAVLVGLGLVVSGSDFDFSLGSEASTLEKFLVIAVVGAAVIVTIAVLVPKARRAARAALAPHVHAARENLAGVLSTPRKAASLFGGQLATQLLYALVLDCALHAYGYSLPLLQLVVVNSLASVIGGLAPVPGGMGAAEAGLIAGLTAAGIPESVAVAATFTHRLFTAYIPPVYGWFALAWLRRRDYV